ncbi:putative F-box/FBD/LRR-repeat protein At3g59240 [Papaver somniferum]|uniref:putative F-box/FBD/LRR-repeat protein At3g59240 n=1 Tax=Papaver somniferum TaxID=3469 RepID=UPI000E6F60D1|nr:putative F-box/FBD/LRR-repeat protein At3g59240 [Papaver somniferum]
MDLNKGEEGVDRIINLPDSLVHHILSFLDIKYVAQTSVLSKRWSYIWITVPILDFQDLECIMPTSSETNKFMDFVDGTLHRRHTGANIERCTITWYKDLNEYRANSWIASACFEINNVYFGNGYWNEKLFSNCQSLNISTPALKHFKIKNWEDAWFPRGEDDRLRGCALKADATNLESFYYNASIAKEYVLTTFPLLDRASVEFRFKPYVATREQMIGLGTTISQFLRALANAKHLSVSDDTLQALSFADDLLKKLPTFHNTKELIIYEKLTADKALVALLKETPNLESLVFHKPVPSDDEDEEEHDIAGSDTVDAAEDDGNKDDAAGSDTDVDDSEGEDNHDSEDDDWMIGQSMW